MKNKLLLILGTFITIIVLSTFLIYAQNRTVSGHVYDASTAQPLFGVTIHLTGSDKGTTTDIDGYYSISGVPHNGVLSFSYIGYTPQNINTGDRTTVDVNLFPDIDNTDRVSPVAE